MARYEEEPVRRWYPVYDPGAPVVTSSDDDDTPRGYETETRTVEWCIQLGLFSLRVTWKRRRRDPSSSTPHRRLRRERTVPHPGPPYRYH